MFANIVQLFGVAARDDVVARRELEPRGRGLDVGASRQRRPSVFAETRTSRTRSWRRIDEGPLPPQPTATSRSGISICPGVVVLVGRHGQEHQVLRETPLVGAQPDAHVVVVALGSSIVVATCPTTPACSVAAIVAP